jgi:HTH-type transcriptional regulator/antitoxin HigA
MKPKLIKTEAEYKQAVKHLEKLGDNPNFDKNKGLKEEFDVLDKLIEVYEKEFYPIGKGDPIEIIKMKMEYMGLKQKDLITAIGSKGIVSEVLNKKRKLSKRMIRELSHLLNISQDILNTEYETSSAPCADIAEKQKSKSLFSGITASAYSHIENFQRNVFQRQSIFAVTP